MEPAMTPEISIEGTEETGIVKTTMWPDGGPAIIEVTAPRGHFEEHRAENGSYISTPGARTLPEEDIHQALGRFRKGDWGNVDQDSREMNDLSRSDGEGTIMGIYQSGQTTFWVHGDGPNTPTVLFPHEY